jgi:hypothetical protein
MNEYYKEDEFKIGEMLVKLKNKNIISYEFFRKETVGDKNYLAIVLEYANAGVFLYFYLKIVIISFSHFPPF